MRGVVALVTFELEGGVLDPEPLAQPQTLIEAIRFFADPDVALRTMVELRWPDGVQFPSCESKHVIKRGFDDTEPARQRYECHDCDKRFDDLINGHR